jgi:hypothetical protein
MDAEKLIIEIDMMNIKTEASTEILGGRLFEEDIFLVCNPAFRIM